MLRKLWLYNYLASEMVAVLETIPRTKVAGVFVIIIGPLVREILINEKIHIKMSGMANHYQHSVAQNYGNIVHEIFQCTCLCVFFFRVQDVLSSDSSSLTWIFSRSLESDLIDEYGNRKVLHITLDHSHWPLL